MKYRVELAQTLQAFMFIEADSPCQAMSEARHVMRYNKLSWEPKEDEYVKDVERVEE